MNLDEIRKLLSQPENPKLEFKQQWYGNADGILDNKDWGELRKDVMGLVNGDVGYVGKPGYLIIGAVDQEFDENGLRKTIHVPRIGRLSRDLESIREWLLSKLKNYFDPPILDLKLTFVEIKTGVTLFVITIPPTTSLLTLAKELITGSRQFKIKKIVIKTHTYPKGAILYRDGEHVLQAGIEKSDRLRADFALLTPPLRNSNFIGRTQEIKEAANTLRKHQPLVICGLPGIGKTALAIEVLNQTGLVNEYPSGMVWIDGTKKSVSQICQRILQTIPGAANTSENTQVNQVKQILKSRSRMLIILDNVSDFPVAHEFCTQISPNTLITTRKRMHLNQGTLLSLDVLENDYAQKLFIQYAEISSTEEELLEIAEIARAVGFHPLALKIAAMRILAESMHLHEMLQRLQNPKYRLNALQLYDENSVETSVLKSFELSWELLSLDTQYVFKGIASFSSSGCSLDALMEVTQLDKIPCADAAGKLVLVGLLERTSDDRYQMHELLRDFGRHLTSEKEIARLDHSLIDWGLAYGVAALDNAFDKNGIPSLSTGVELRKRLFGFGLSYGLERIHVKVNKESLDALELELPNLLHVIQKAENCSKWHEFGLLCMMLNKGQAGILSIRGYWDESARLGYRLLDVVHRGTDLNFAYIVMVLEQILMYQGKFNELKDLQPEREQAAKLWELMGNPITEDPSGERLLRKYGAEYINAERRKDFLPEKMQLARKYGDDFHIAHVAHALAQYYQEQGDLEAAWKSFQESFTSLNKIGDIRGSIILLEALADLAFEQQKFDAAIDFVHTALDKAQKSHLFDPLNSARLTLAQSLLMIGKRTESQEIALEILSDLKKINDQRGIAVCTNMLGSLAYSNTRYSQAIDYLQQSLEHATYLPNDAQIETHHMLAQAANQTGNKLLETEQCQLLYEAERDELPLDTLLYAINVLTDNEIDRGNWVKARQLNNVGLRKIRRTNGNPVLVVNLYVFTIRLKRIYEKDRKKTRYYLRKAKRVLETIDSSETRDILLTSLAEEALNNQDIDLAFEFKRMLKYDPTILGTFKGSFKQL